MMFDTYNKRLMLIVRLMLFAVGGAVGIVALYQVFYVYPDLVNKNMRIFFYAVSMLVPAFLFLLSARPVLFLAILLTGKVKNKFSSVKAASVAVALCGAAAGALLGYLCDAVLGLFMNLWALQIFIDLIVALVGAYFAALVFLSWLSSSNADEGVEPVAFKGYVLTASAFSSPLSVPLCRKWLDGKVCVCAATVKLLAAAKDGAAGGKAFENYKVLCDEKAIRILSFFESETDGEPSAVAAAANAKKLKVITLDKADAERFTDAAVVLFGVLALDELTA